MRKRTIPQFSSDVGKVVAYFEQFLRDFHTRAIKIADEERVKGIAAGQQPDGTSLKGLKEKTIERKRKKHWSTDSMGNPKKYPPSKTPDKPLMDQHILNKTKKGASKDKGWLKLWPGRVKIARFQEEQGRANWGIYKDAREKILDLWFKRWKVGLRILSKGMR